MSNSRMIATRKRPVFMSHICSKCGFPVISIVWIEAEAQKDIIFLQEKAAKIAAETADNAINEEIARIESVKNSKLVLACKASCSSMIAPGHFCNSSISGFQTPCPFCLHIEPWQSSSSNQPMDALQDDNFPTVFTDAQKAEEWAHNRVKAMVEAIIDRNGSQDAKDKATRNAVIAHLRANMLSQMIGQLPERNMIRQLEDEKKQLSERREQLGILDFGGRKNVSIRLTAIDLELGNLRKVLSSKETPLLDELLKTTLDKMLSQIIAFGSPGEVVCKKSEDTFVYYYSVYSIPQPLIEGFEKQNANGEFTGLRAEALETNKSKSKKTEVNAPGAPVFCRKCGSELAKNSVFCSKCGMRVG